MPQLRPLSWKRGGNAAGNQVLQRAWDPRHPPSPHPPRFPNHPCMVPGPRGTGDACPPLPLRGAVQLPGRGQPGLFLESSPIVPRSGTGAKSSSCNLRVALGKPPRNNLPHVDPAAP